MAFTDLPEDLSRIRLSDPTHLPDMLDLVVSEQDRHRGALVVLLCDDQDRLRAPVVLGELPDELTEEERVRALALFVTATGGRGSVLVAVARADGLGLRPGDAVWRRAAERACQGGPRLLGVHVVTLNGSREVPEALAA